MTRSDVQQRVMLECESAAPGAEAFELATPEYLDQLWEAIRDALEEMRDQVVEAGGTAPPAG